MKLEKYLVLNKYFLSLFGFEDFNDLREKLKNTNEGYDSTGRSYFVDTLIGLKPELENNLLRYDEVIKEYIERLKQNRRQINFNLKYFQYLAVLFTEIFLDKYFNEKEDFLNELNDFLKKFNQENRSDIKPFKEEDLKKLAFWMATGSGKTLLMHINYRQILKYSKNKWDNIILITPNEGLSKQHYEELKLSGIPSKLYDGNIDNLRTKDGEILIIDIHKLTKEKKGEGVSVDISYFDGRNLVFIDEGHKGQRSEEQKWKKLREEIAKEGFLFEYSATFGQVIGKNKDLLEEYSKAIIFDYSYKYFYTDGYGKDFYIYNIKSEKKENKEYYTEEQQDLLLIAGLLSFFEQLIIYEKHKGELREYNIEKPLWIFVGSKVSGKGINSDVIKVIQFLEKIIKDENYLKENIQKILKEKSGLIDNEGNDIFKNKFEYLKKITKEITIDKIVNDIYQKVFGGKGNLELYDIKSADGEIGLKTSTGEQYFGVINIGNINDFLFYFKPEKIKEKIEKVKNDKKKKLEDIQKEINELSTILQYIEKHPNLIPKDDHLTQSLFFDINQSNSQLNVLIGSKKFVEGWNSWRVSNIGLINMGKGEGPQIIQLFGRGVRLKGRNYSLKREENLDYKIKVLQTLFIFGLNADYINAFLKTIEQEEVDYEEIEIPIIFNQREKWEKQIHIIKTKDDFDFLNYKIKLEKDEKILQKIKIDLRSKVTMAHGLNVDIADTETDESIKIPGGYFDLLDWQFIYSEIINYKLVNGYYNLVLDKENIKDIAKSQDYELFINETKDISIDERNNIKIKSFVGLKKLQDIILMVLKDYILKFYNNKFKKESMNYLKLEKLSIDDHLHMYPENKRIIVKIPKDLINDIKETKRQLENYSLNKIPEEWEEMKSFIIHFDNHLYTPLIVWEKNKDKIKSFPVKLNKGETKFIKDFKNYLSSYPHKFRNKKIFLLRNLSKKGVGFFINAGFYPDFILWIKDADKERIIFIDPKGIRNLGDFKDDKIQFCNFYIKEIEKKIKEENKDINIELDAFILSITLYKDVKEIFGERNHSKEEFEKHKILFLEEENKYLDKFFKILNEVN